MIIIHKAGILRDYLRKQRNNGLSIGFVPTMGALHAGHLSLIHQCAADCDITVCSIFVNPTQFNDPSDYDKYPVTLENDIRILSTSPASVLYAPTVNEVYPEGTTSLEHYDLGFLETLLEGKFRPGHFQGVCQVMSRLLRTVDANKLFMGQKDYQQCMVVKRLLTLINQRTELITCATLRENDGLAMSSRNMRLTAEQRKKAPLIFAVLSQIRNDLVPGNVNHLKQEAITSLKNGGFKPEYVEIADADTLSPCDEWDGREKLVALTAAFLGDVRLIDNVLLNS